MGGAPRQCRGDRYSCAERRSDSHKQQQKKRREKYREREINGTSGLTRRTSEDEAAAQLSTPVRGRDKRWGRRGAVEETKGEKWKEEKEK